MEEKIMNIMQMMQQAQDLQKKLKVAQDELAKLEVTGEAADGAVIVTCDGQGKFKSIKLTKSALSPENPEAIDTDTVEMLEDLITTAMNQATTQATSEMQTKMKALTGGINIPGLF